jgi:2-polyprenyl-3-methyl-5-hydroxy-6-metoxy-1,4-benzoquinol methylase
MKCPCPSHNEPLQQVFAHGETDFRRCNICGLVFRESFPDPDQLEGIYKRAFSSESILRSRTDQESGEHAIDAYAVFLSKSLITNRMKVLDFGAATGALVAQLRNRGIDADGVELSPEARLHCLQQRGFELIASLDEVDSGLYDIVILIEVIEHVTQLHATLSRLRDILKPGGIIFITTPNLDGYRALIEKGMWAEARKKFHLFLFSLASLSFHLSHTGFGAIRRINYGPVQRRGIKFWLMARAAQLVGLSGTLCVVANKIS